MAALRDVLAQCPGLFERGVPVRLIEEPVNGLVARPLTPDSLLMVTYQACRPYVLKKSEDGSFREVDAIMPVTWP